MAFADCAASGSRDRAAAAAPGNLQAWSPAGPGLERARLTAVKGPPVCGGGPAGASPVLAGCRVLSPPGSMVWLFVQFVAAVLAACMTRAPGVASRPPAAGTPEGTRDVRFLFRRVFREDTK